ncbi:MAG: 2-amino-4-hydroxy-6-hydroxymethyldihydropteridine diphosphokinase [Porticoccaceae bacterium]|nr:2-amino-4-hydroxy-6-hydroxymethyldihydropteridine diphosphokinase [Porticoccaceae bacterium]
MAFVYVSIGSNIDQTQNIRACLDALAEAFGDLRLSSVYESEAVGFGGDNFYNLVAGFECPLTVAGLSALLRQIETANGRRRDGPRFSSRTLDIDILTYDDRVGMIDGINLPRDEILENAFVLWPLAEIAASEVHPETGESYGSLWRDYDKDRQKLWPIDFTWNGRRISSADPG